MTLLLAVIASMPYDVLALGLAVSAQAMVPGALPSYGALAVMPVPGTTHTPNLAVPAAKSTGVRLTVVAAGIPQDVPPFILRPPQTADKVFFMRTVAPFRALVDS